MTLPAITVEGVIFEYPGVRALDDVSFSIHRGSTTALVGPNGAGKTTLLRCIAALEQPLAGQITVDGLDMRQEPRSGHRRLGYISDNFGLYESLTVAQCLRYAAEANGVAPGEVAQAVADTAERLGLTWKLPQRAGELSRGQRQRVAIGQAIIHQPEVLLLDEPASGLDPQARHELSLLFRRLRNDGMTLLVSSHILAELAEYSTDMLILKGGRVIDQRPVLAPHAITRLRLSLAKARSDAAALLAGQAGVGHIEAHGGHIHFDFAGTAHDRHRLLRELLATGLPICGLCEITSDLQASYLASVGSEEELE